jgi:hypothetical protein
LYDKKRSYECFSNSKLLESPELNPLDFCLWIWMNREVYKINMDTRDELLTRILGVAARIKERED